MTPLQTIILAAGKGVRFKSETPKVLHKVCGRALIDYVLDVVQSLSSLKIFVVVGHKSDVVTQHIGSRAKAVLQKELLGTADAIKRVAPFIKNKSGDTLVLCGDTPLLRLDIIKSLLKKHKSSKAICTFLTAIMPNPTGYGRVIRDEQGHVIAICEEKDAAPHQKRIKEINTGVYCFKTKELFDIIKAVKMNQKKKEFYLTDVVSLLFEKGNLVETVTTDDCFEGLGINTREELALAEDTLRKRILKKFMAEGVTIVDPSTTFIGANVKIGNDTVIRPFTVIEEDVTIGSHCVIGPFCHLRPKTKIGNTVEVGNFAEISRASIGDNCFMKHFSFIGDASVGNDVNIGAGVVTANFDGKNKNFTTIDDHAFIGSDSILVAPVKIGKKAITGAGSVVTKGKVIPQGAVAIGVPAKIMARREK